MKMEVRQAQSTPEVELLWRELAQPVALVRQMAFCLEPKKPEQTEAFRKKIIAVTEKNLRLIHDLERLRKAEAEQIQKEAVSVRAIVEETQEEVREYFLEHGKRLMMEFQGKDRVVWGEREAILTVLYNLTTGMVNYTNETGEGWLKVRAGRKIVRFEIRDFGPIIPTKISTEINKKTLAWPTKIPMRPDESGLGLYLSVRFLDWLGARVGVARHPDGMSVWFEMPTINQGRLF